MCSYAPSAQAGIVSDYGKLRDWIRAKPGLSIQARPVVTKAERLKLHKAKMAYKRERK